MTGLEHWIIGQGLGGTSLADLVAGVAAELLAEGVDLARAYLALPTVNPTIRVVNHTWTRLDGITVEYMSHDRNYTAFEASPLAVMLREDVRFRHWRFTEPGMDEFPLFDGYPPAGRHRLPGPPRPVREFRLSGSARGRARLLQRTHWRLHAG